MKTENTNKEHLDVLHFEHEAWVKQLSFYKDELKIYTNRLEEIAERYNGRGVMMVLEQFQNQFIRQNEVIDILDHDINAHEQILVNSVKENPVASNHRLFNDHDGLRDRMATFLKLYNELKPNFMRYLVKYM
ncbi:hypothetical protein N9K26_00165 [Flavobacteriales bacterium]|nr:hypothetical protein [Flavobacteriales bacterium]MDA9775620.1 hypothetical protein [Flavobacteriales bacterium]